MKNWNQYSKEHYVFILSQAEKKLTATVDTMNAIQNRGRFQVALTISILTGTIGWFIGNHNTEYTEYAISIVVLTLISLTFALFGIFNYKINTPGSLPSDLFNAKFYNSFEENIDAEINIIYSECTDYSQRIEQNFKTNQKRLRYVTISFISLALIPVFIGIIYLFSGYC